MSNALIETLADLIFVVGENYPESQKYKQAPDLTLLRCVCVTAE